MKVHAPLCACEIIYLIEVIEHVQLETELDCIMEIIFKTYRPKYVFLTTPNSDFNSNFDMEPGKFRHWDHKYEFSQQEFKDWCDKQVLLSEGYTYEIFGVGTIENSPSELGYCSQGAIFTRPEHIQKLSCADRDNLESNFECFFKCNYPYTTLEARQANEIKIKNSTIKMQAFAVGSRYLEEISDRSSNFIFFLF